MCCTQVPVLELFSIPLVVQAVQHMHTYMYTEMQQLSSFQRQSATLSVLIFVLSSKPD